MANTIADKLTYLANTKSAIKSAIEAKGVEVPSDTTFREYAEKIEEIEGGGSSNGHIELLTYHDDGEYVLVNNYVRFTPTTTPVTEGFEVSNLSDDYGFELNSDGYYESNNAGEPGSYAVCEIKFQTTHYGIVLKCVNNGTLSSDYGVVSQLDQALNLDNVEDPIYFQSFKNIPPSTTEQEVFIPVGDSAIHIVTIKYLKASASVTNGDSFKFKVMFDD